MSWRNGYLSDSSNFYWKCNTKNKLDEEKWKCQSVTKILTLPTCNPSFPAYDLAFFKKVASCHFILKTQPTVSGSLLRHVLWKNVVFEVCAPIHVKNCAEADFSGLHFLSKRLQTVPSNLLHMHKQMKGSSGPVVRWKANKTKPRPKPHRS